MPASDQRATEQKKLPGIFISYRRSDTPDAVGRIYDRLVAEFGKARVFKDVDSIPLGQDFRGHLNDIVGGCAAVLAIIGPKWTDIRNEAGLKRLEDPDDFVRIELEAALARSVPVVPVLVGHAPMPGTSQLPSSLASLAFRQSIEVRPDPDFHNDATRLVVALKQIIDPNAPRADVSVTSPKKSQGSRWLSWGIAAVATLVAIAFAIPALKHLREMPPVETRIAIDLPIQEDTEFALSPDGQQILYQASGDSRFRLWLRSLSATTAQPVPGTDKGFSPFWSPDGRSMGFFASGSLKRLDLNGGQPQTLATAKTVAGNPTLGIWGANGDILFGYLGVPISRIGSNGGAAKALAGSAPKNPVQIPLSVLPDGRHFLFAGSGEKSDGIYLGTLDGVPPERLTADLGPATYLPSGWMVSLPIDSNGKSKGLLLAQRLDLRSAKLVGEPALVAAGVSKFSTSKTGLIAYITARVTGRQQLTWVDRSGAVVGTMGDANGSLNNPRIAPDGRRAAGSHSTTDNLDIWILEGARSSRVTTDSSDNRFPVWSPDGAQLIFSLRTSGGSEFHQRLANGAGADELLLTFSNTNAYPLDWSSDGRYLLYVTGTIETSGDIWVLPMTGNRKAFVFLRTKFNESRAQFSPDGRWVAYQSDLTGINEVYVRPFVPLDTTQKGAGSDAAGGESLVSTAGGVDPVWRADGKEIYYINSEGDMMAAPVAFTGSTIVPGVPVRLFAAKIYGGGTTQARGRQYDVAKDGRFLINREVVADAIPTMILIQNWNPDAKK